VCCIEHRSESEAQTQVLTSALLSLERDPAAADALEACMRAAHSLKGAALVVGLTVGVQLAHAMEDVFVAAQQSRKRTQNRLSSFASGRSGWRSRRHG
jgi:two-component system sensor histidine kinase and response regulator WspE